MEKSKKVWRRIGAFFVCISLMVTALPGIFWTKAFASVADDQEASLLGTLNAKYESNGDPGTISSGSGDLGGKSYGAYQLASQYDIPKHFFTWCIQQTSKSSYVDMGTQLQTAYTADGSTYGTNFDSVWKALAAVGNTYGGTRGIFWQAQRDFIRLRYYDPIVSAIESSVFGFSMANYGIALRNVFWSRSVQHGSGGAKGVITSAFDTLGGFVNQDEATLIDAIYAESGAVGAPRNNVMSGDIAVRLGIVGASLDYYSGNSSDVQLGVYQRLRIKEVADAQQMLANNGFTGAPLAQGVYQLTLGSSAHTYRLNYLASGYYTLTATDSSGQRLTASGSSAVSAAASASDAQCWRLAASGSGYTLLNKATGTYLNLSGSSLALGASAAVWTVTPSASDWRLSGATYPTTSTYWLYGYGFPIRGTLSSTFPISKVTISVINNGTGEKTTASASPNATSFNLADLDSSVRFSPLSPGQYTYQITATNTGGASVAAYTLNSVFHVVPDGKDTGTCNLIFNAMGGSCSTVYRQVASGGVYGALPTPTMSNYIFNGWFTSPVGGTAVTASTVASSDFNQMIYAHYTYSPDANISNFVTQLYQSVLGRAPSSSELSNWVANIRTGAYTAAHAAAYFFSCDEYQSKTHTDAAFATALYKALLGRTPSSSEVSSLVTQLASCAVSRSDIFAAVCGSQEFIKLYAAYGITAGNITAASYDLGEDPTSARAFVRRLYQNCLGRQPDAAGLTNWSKSLKSGSITGAQAAASFFISSEYQNGKHSNQEFVTSLYTALLGRQPGSSEVNSWCATIASGGSSRSQVFNGFCGSQEFIKLCATYGITAGLIDPSQYDMGEDLTSIQSFVTRLYKTCLGREPDAGGLANWTRDLKAGSITGAQASAGFFASYEYLSKNNSVEQFVTTLYNVLLNRQPGASEVKSWSDKIYNRTYTRAQVFDGFCGSSEFNELCASYGIKAGRIDPSSYDMGEVYAFVTRLYQLCLNRTPDETGLKNWVGSLQSKSISGAQAAAGFFFSHEFLEKKLSSQAYVNLLYNVLLNRQPSATESSGWINDINTGKSTRAQVLNGFAGSPEFNELCAAYNITAGSINPSDYAG